MGEKRVNNRKAKLVHKHPSAAFLSDNFSGLISALFVAPFCTIVDKGIIQNANGSVPLWHGVSKGLKELFYKPTVFAGRKQFHLLYFVYGSTYCAANTSESICEYYHIDPILPKLFTTFIVNTMTGIYKDRSLTQLFGTTEIKKFPKISYGLFWARDLITIAFAFTLPKILGKKLSNHTEISLSTSTKIFQIACPLVIQLVATPLHILGLDYYNNENRNFSDRLKFTRNVVGYSTMLRMLRYLPAYGLAGILNLTLREKFEQLYH